MDLFEQFDISISRGCQNAASSLSGDRRKTVLLRELLTNKGFFNKNLYEFVQWLISSSDREQYVTSNCNINFIRSSPTKGKAEPYSLIKISIHAESKCNIPKKDKEWTKQCLSQWKKHTEAIIDSPQHSIMSQKTMPNKFSPPRPTTPTVRTTPTTTRPSTPTGFSPPKKSSPLKSGAKTFTTVSSPPSPRGRLGPDSRLMGTPPVASLKRAHSPDRQLPKSKKEAIMKAASSTQPNTYPHDNHSDISSLSCSITLTDHCENDMNSIESLNNDRNDYNPAAIMLQPLTAYSLLLNHNTLPPFPLQSAVVDRKVDLKYIPSHCGVGSGGSSKIGLEVIVGDKSKSVGAEMKEPLEEGTKDGAMNDVDCNASRDETIELNNVLMSKQDPIVPIPTAVADVEILPSPIPAATIRDKEEKDDNLIKEREEDNGVAAVKAVECVAVVEKEASSVPSLTEKAAVCSILKQRTGDGTANTEQRKAKKSVDFTGISFDTGEESAVPGDSSGGSGKHYRQRLLMPSTEAKDAAEEDLLPSNAFLNAHRPHGHVRAHSVMLTDTERAAYLMDSDLPTLIPNAKQASEAFAKLKARENNRSSTPKRNDDRMAYHSNPLNSNNSPAKQSLIKSQMHSPLRTISDETICSAFANANPMDEGRVIVRSPSPSTKAKSALEFPPRHIRSQSLDSKLRSPKFAQSVSVNALLNTKFEKPKVLPVPPEDNFTPPSDDSTCSKRSDSPDEDDDLIKPELLLPGDGSPLKRSNSFGTSTGILSAPSFFFDRETVKLREELSQVENEYRGHKSNAERARKHLINIWEMKYKECMQSLRLPGDDNGELRKQLSRFSSEKGKLEKEFHTSDEAFEKLCSYIDANMSAEMTAKERMQKRLASRKNAVNDFQKRTENINAVHVSESTNGMSTATLPGKVDSLQKTHHQLSTLLRFQIAMQSALITSEIIDQLQVVQECKKPQPQFQECSACHCLAPMRSIRCAECSKSFLDGSAVSSLSRFENKAAKHSGGGEVSSIISPEVLKALLEKKFSGYLHQFDGAMIQWKRMFFVIERGELRIYNNGSPEASPVQRIDCDEGMEIFDAAQSTFSDRGHIFYLHFENVSDSFEISRSNSTDNTVIFDRPKKIEVLYLSADSEDEKAEWIDAIATAIHVNSSSKSGEIDRVKSGDPEDVESVIFQPDIWPSPFQPTIEMTIQYSPDVEVNNGNSIGMKDLSSRAPQVHFDGPLDGYNALIMVDLDSRSKDSEDKKEVCLHWAVLNITGSKDISSGQEVN